MAHLALRLLPLALLLFVACAGDSQVFHQPPIQRGLALDDFGLSPDDPGPLDDAIAWARVRDARSVRIHWAAVHESEALDPGFDPSGIEYEQIELVAVDEPDAVAFQLWEVELPARGDEKFLFYWFEAEDGDRFARGPAGGADEPRSVAAQPIVVDFEWPDWPPLSAGIPCIADRERVFDGAEDEETLVPTVPFEVIRDPIWKRVEQAVVVLGNVENLARGIGVEIGGEAYFFPLIIMLWNEVSNQSIGGRQTAMTYCPLTDTAFHFDTGFDAAQPPKWHDYAPAGLFNSNLSVAITGLSEGAASVFNQMLGFSFNGPDSERCLDPLPSLLTEFNVWRRLHPDTWVLEGDPELEDTFDYTSRANPYRNYWRDDDELRSAVAREDSRLNRKTLVMGVMGGGDPVAIPLTTGDFVHHTRVQSIDVVVFQQAQTAIALEAREPVTGEALRFSPTRTTWRSFTLYRDDRAEPSLWTLEGVALTGPSRGRRLAWMPSMSAFWFAWYAMYPETRLESPSTP